MDYSPEQIEAIKELASCLTPIPEIAILMGVDLDTLRLDIRNRETLVSQTYHYAKASTAMQLRKQEIELAKVGSPLAVQLTNGYLLNMDSDEDL